MCYMIKKVEENILLTFQNRAQQVTFLMIQDKHKIALY